MEPETISLQETRAHLVSAFREITLARAEGAGAAFAARRAMEHLGLASRHLHREWVEARGDERRSMERAYALSWLAWRHACDVLYGRAGESIDIVRDEVTAALAALDEAAPPALLRAA